MGHDMWGHQADSGYRTGTDLTGYRVEASDGHIGRVDEHSREAGSGYVVVDTGPWIFGRHVLLPAGTITLIDSATRTVRVARTREEIKDSPGFDRAKHTGDVDYQQQIGAYYGMWPM